MLSRSEYRGKLPYDTYVKRYKKHESVIFPTKKSTDLPTPGKDIAPTEEEIKKYLEKNKQDLSDKSKELIKKQIEKKTGAKFKDLQDAINQLESEGDDSEEGKEHREHMLKGLQLSRALQPNTENLTPQERIRAKLVEASKKGYMFDDNFETAQQYLKSQEDTGGYVIDRNLSTKEGIVVRTPTNETEIHYRSSQFTGTPSKTDLATNFRIATGFESEDPQFIQAKQQYENAVNEYGSVEHFGGASKGGGKAIYMGQKYDVPSTTFNPVIGTKTARGITSTTQEHTIIRTTGDPTSLGLAVSSNANHENWNVKSLRPLKKNVGLNPIKNAFDAHKHDNFTENRNPNNVSMDNTTIENTFLKVAENSHKTQQYSTLDTMKTQYIEKGKTYSDYIFDLQKGSKTNFSGDNDIGLTNGKPLIKGNRHIQGGEGPTGFWEAMGGTFTDEEKSLLGKKPVIKAKSLDEQMELQMKEEAKQSMKKKLGSKQKTKAMKQRQEIEGKLGASPPTEIETIEPELNKFINRSQLDIKPTPEEVRIRETQEDEFAKIEGDKKKPATVTEPTTESDFVDIRTPNFQKLTKEEIAKFANSDRQGRIKIMNDHNIDSVNDIHDLGQAMTPAENAGFREHFGEAINPVSMGAGMLVGFGTDAALDYLDPADDPDGKPRQQAITGVKREALSGAITGGLMYGGTTALGGTTVGLAPEIAAGAVGYVAGAETGKLVASGVKKLGGNDDEQALAADTVGGAVGGAAAAGTLIGTAALTGAELGSAGGPLGIAIGAGVGVLGGALGFGVSEIIKHKNDIKKGFSDAGNAIANVAKSTGNFFKKLF
jgi:hypothetical protein